MTRSPFRYVRLSRATTDELKPFGVRDRESAGRCTYDVDPETGLVTKEIGWLVVWSNGIVVAGHFRDATPIDRATLLGCAEQVAVGEHQPSRAHWCYRPKSKRRDMPSWLTYIVRPVRENEAGEARAMAAISRDRLRDPGRSLESQAFDELVTP